MPARLPEAPPCPPWCDLLTHDWDESHWPELTKLCRSFVRTVERIDAEPLQIWLERPAYADSERGSPAVVGPSRVILGQNIELTFTAARSLSDLLRGVACAEGDCFRMSA